MALRSSAKYNTAYDKHSHVMKTPFDQMFIDLITSFL